MTKLCTSELDRRDRRRGKSEGARTDHHVEHHQGDSMSSAEVNFKIQDEGRLAELGYTQELTREWSLLHNFGASFSIIVC